MVVLGFLVAILALFLSGPVVTDQVELNTFAPLHIIHVADLIMAGFLLFFIATNIIRMHKYILREGMDRKIPLKLYFTEAWELILHTLTQKRWIQCDEDKEDKEGIKKWLTHLLMMSGYGLMLIMVLFFLNWFQTDEIYELWHPQRLLGYYATAVLIYGSGSAIWGRIKKKTQLHRFSHLSDWIFPILLLAVSITGILIHSFRYFGLPLATYYTYIIHLAFVAPMLVLEVPFGKWSHLYYRPLSIYFQSIKEKMKQDQTAKVNAPVGTD